MDYRIIKAPTSGVSSILQRRIDASTKLAVKDYEAIGLMQGKLCDMVFAADVAEKASGVTVVDVRGNCPQNLVMIAVFGDTSSVETAMKKISEEIEQQKVLFRANPK
ncbi:BMC domain-containing protein [uncultured Veillonella sp.]|uniref:BMC domain-containing protein n=1 Tax=uncultured Veillonella sp. TaxID=159268 RepID=UPI0025CFD8DE|nr:BMC domain-containing protein [uncultured Veillonella sp.]MDY3973867.1 BMC domain-containing protein [Veillonella caviae]